jgi:hypothetical protein
MSISAFPDVAGTLQKLYDGAPFMCVCSAARISVMREELLKYAQICRRKRRPPGHAAIMLSGRTERFV